MRKNLRNLGLLVVAGCMAVTAAQVQAADAPASRPARTTLDLSAARTIPVQYGGRVMPLDTLARQIAWQVTGKQSLQGLDPVELLLGWTWQSDFWRDQPVVLVGSPDLQEKVGLPVDAKRFSYAELMGNRSLMQLMGTKPLADDDTSESAVLRSAQQVAFRLDLLAQVFKGGVIRLVPSKDPHAAWATIDEAAQTMGQADRMRLKAALDKMREGFVSADAAGFDAGARELTVALAGMRTPTKGDPSLIALEVRYNQFRPFRLGWVLACLAMAIGLVELGWPKKPLRYATWVLLAAGFVALTAGIIMRWRFAGHAPLATMYESLVFMGWGAVAIGLVTAAVVQLRSSLAIIAGVATAILIVADTAPLDSISSPLVPVLRNTMWLTYHVLTIMLAYSAFALAMGVGHVQAAFLAFRPGNTERTGQTGRLLYGMLIVGCVFLAAGIIFGAIWANKSWGRYWGWDPKETWSLITLLGYMAILHGRLVGWIRSFGLAICSILGFQLVLMTYYGVNFVLGRGLHSYGFSSGGQLWIGLYVAAELAFVLWMWALHTRLAGAAPAGQKAFETAASE